MKYVDGFLIPIPKKNMRAYTAMAKKAGKVWMKYGALEYRECVLHDGKVPPGCTTFTKGARAKAGETAIFSWIVYKSKAHRDAVNKKVMKDPWMLEMMSNTKMPFDPRKMMYGGFKVIVDA